MTSHYSAIGLPFESEEEFIDLAERAAQECELYESPHGRYLRSESVSGAELWLQLDAEDNLIGMNPHFAGKSRVRVSLTERITRPDSSPLDGAFQGWADPQEENPEQGAYPFVFDVPDFRLYDELELPGICDVAIAAFAHEATLFESVEAYEAAQTDEPSFAAQSFIPSGLFAAAEDASEPAQALAIFTGIIRETELRTNEFSGKPFQWVLVESLGGTFDVVIDPALLNGEPRIGGVLQGSFWLTGRLLAE